MELLELLTIKKEMQEQDILIEDCSLFDESLTGMKVVLEKERTEDVITYLYEKEIHPAHLKEVFQKNPVMVLQKLLYDQTKEKSFTVAMGNSKFDTRNRCENTFYPDKQESKSYGERVQIDYMEVEPVQIQICGDYSGKLSDIMDRLSAEIEQVVIPFSLTDIFEQVLSLKRYDVRVFRGMRYASSKKIREEIVNEYKEQAIESLKNGIPYKEPLWTTFEYKGNVYETLKLTVSEWTMLCNMFRNYDAGVFQSAENDLQLVIG